MVISVLLFSGCSAVPEPKKSSDDASTAKTIRKASTTTQPAAEKSEPLTMKQAYALLKAKAGTPDLGLFSYMGFSVNAEGKTASYTISGYSPSKDDVFYLTADENRGLEFGTNENPDTHSVIYPDLDKIKDSSELVSEAVAKNTACPTGVDIMISPVKGKPASMLCSKSHWSQEISVEK